MKLSELREGKGRLTKEASVSGLCTDSRVAEKGDLFFCFRGTKADAHEFAEEAVRRGASAIVCERELSLPVAQLIVPDGRRAMAEISAAFYSHPERAMKFIGVTGTNGKTTTCALIRSILKEAGEETGLVGTLGVSFKDTKIPPDLTTPDPPSFFSLLAKMREEGVKTVVMEASAHALALEKLSPVRFFAGIFTNLTRDHLDFFQTMEQYGAAKKKLFEQSEFGIYNADDPFSRELSASIPHMTYGLDSPADAFALIEREELKGSRVLMNLSDELCECEISLTGRHNVQNALAAACAAKRFGVSMEEIARGIEELKGVDGRLEHVASFRGAEIFVDFAHTPDGLEKSLSSLKEHCEGRLFAVFGCGGGRDEGKREMMGRVAARFCDFCVLTSDNPRFEEPCSIIAEIERGYRETSKEYIAIEERDRAIEYALSSLKEGDVLLVAGKGGETYQEIMGIKYEFDDKDIIKTYLQGRS